jgi:hypothetical protein
MGMTSVVLGMIALLVFFMPVLGIPISSLGLLFGIVGLMGAIFGWGATLRGSLSGIAICSLALLIHVALAYAPAPGYIPRRDVPPPWEPPPGRPSVPPPAVPG